MAIFIDDLKTVDDLGNQVDLSALVEDAAGGSDEPPRVRTGTGRHDRRRPLQLSTRPNSSQGSDSSAMEHSGRVNSNRVVPDTGASARPVHE